MSKQRRLITALAIAGLVVAGVVLLFVQFGDFDAAPSLYFDFVIICPPALLIFALGDMTRNTGGAYVVWTLIIVLNSGVYALVGAAIAGLLGKFEK